MNYLKKLFNNKIIKNIILSILILLFILPTILYAEDEPYFNVFNQVYEYDNGPTLKIEAYFDDKPVLSNMLKNEYESLISTIPLKYKLQLKENKVTIHLVEHIGKYFSYRHPDDTISGCFNSSNMNIYITIGYDEEYDTYEYAAYRVGYCLYHEIGHALDHIYDNKSNLQEFKVAFNEENINNNLSFCKNSSEIFAEIFQNYMFDYADILHIYNSSGKYFNTKKFPKCYKFVINILNLEDIYANKYVYKYINNIIYLKISNLFLFTF